jgi:hypothetical protein
VQPKRKQKTRFELDIKCGNLDVAFEMAKVINWAVGKGWRSER